MRPRILCRTRLGARTPSKPLYLTHKIALLSITVLLSACADSPDNNSSTGQAAPALTIIFDETTTDALADSDRNVITEILSDAESSVRELLPDLPDSIEVTVGVIDRDVDVVGGVVGRADAPGAVTIQLSTVYPGGVQAAAEAALAPAAFHEFHHLARGWTIQGNRFGPGIPTAAVNEGLASVFAEEYTGAHFEEAYGYPENADEWLSEIRSLPVDADYQQWVMGEHPDGRNSIGYRVGRYIVHQAAEHSGKEVLALSELSPAEILELAEGD